ncbi:glycosyltransferase [Rhodococcus pyridinivorans]
MNHSDIDALRGKRTLLAASTGGHLAQLARLSGKLGVSSDSHWITFDHPQSRSLLAGQSVTFIPYIAPRDYKNLFRSFAPVREVLKNHELEAAVSTGAGIALGVLPTAKLMGREAVYIESISRFDGPSLSGRILARVPGIGLYTQHRTWSSERWKFKYSVLDDYVPTSKTSKVDAQRLRVFVTLGTIKPYRFDRLVDRLLQILPTNCEITWQTGVTERTDLPGDVHDTVTAEMFERFVKESDVVVSHAGVGSAMQILDLGKCPVLVPRQSAFGEHVDDHQAQIARDLGEKGLAVSVAADAIDFDDLVSALQVSVSA